MKTDRCDAKAAVGEDSAILAIRDTTVAPAGQISQPEFRGAWPRGLEIEKLKCSQPPPDAVREKAAEFGLGGQALSDLADDTGNLSEPFYTDIILDYMTLKEWLAGKDHTVNFGGHVHSEKADPLWCEYWKQPKINGKCGIHPSRIHINFERYSNYATDSTRKNFLIHETSHSYGFYDDCTIDAVSNNIGDSTCALPAGWIGLDRQELRDHIYRGWPYP